VRRGLVLAALIPVAVAVLSIAFAGHIVGNPSTYVLQPVTNPVIWVAGTNNGSTDINGQPIVVTISPNGTVATVQTTITYGENQYLDLLRINVTNAPWTAWLYVDATSNVTTYLDLAKSYIIVVDPTTGLEIYKGALSAIFANNSIGGPITLDSNQQYVVDLVLYMKDGVPLPTGNLVLNLRLYYTKTTEKPIAT